MRTQTCSNLTFALLVLLAALVAAPCARAHEFRLAAWSDSTQPGMVTVRAGGSGDPNAPAGPVVLVASLR